MKKYIKKIIPPFLFDILLDFLMNKNFNKYKNLIHENIKYKNIHKWKRCFILGSWPSIKKENLKPLKNEIVFALNNFYVHDDFSEIMNNNIEKYYITAPIHSPQTENEWKMWFEDMEKYIPQNTNLIFWLNNYKSNIKYILDKYNIFKKHNVNWYFAWKIFDESFFKSKSMDITNSIYSWETVSIYALIIAIYMWFDEIYLLGMDHDYFLYENENQMRMYKNAIHQKNEFKRSFGNEFYTKEFLRQYKIFTKYQSFGNNTDCKIFNASNGWVLRIFPKVEFKTLFK
jgi:hypothetical protein